MDDIVILLLNNAIAFTFDIHAKMQIYSRAFSSVERGTQTSANLYGLLMAYRANNMNSYDYYQYFVVE